MARGWPLSICSTSLQLGCQVWAWYHSETNNSVYLWKKEKLKMLPMLYGAFFRVHTSNVKRQNGTELKCENRMKLKAAFSGRYKYGDLYHRRLYFIYTHFYPRFNPVTLQCTGTVTSFYFLAVGTSSPFLPSEYCLRLLKMNNIF